jgi:hypothetical protein
MRVFKFEQIPKTKPVAKCDAMVECFTQPNNLIHTGCEIVQQR